MLHIAFLSKNTVHVLAQRTAMQHGLDASQNRSWDHGTCPGQRTHVVGMRRRLPPVADRTEVENHRERWVKKCKACSSFESTEQLGSVTKPLRNKAKITLRPVSKSNKQFNIGCSKYCFGSTLESNLHFADPYKFHLKPKYFSIHLPANIC